MRGSVDDLLSIDRGDQVSEDVRPDRDRFFTVQKGKGELWIDGRKTDITTDFRVFVPASLQRDARAWARSRSRCKGGRRSA